MSYIKSQNPKSDPRDLDNNCSRCRRLANVLVSAGAGGEAIHNVCKACAARWYLRLNSRFKKK